MNRKKFAIFNSLFIMAGALPQYKNIEEINAEDSSSKLEEYLCSSLDKGAKVK